MKKISFLFVFIFSVVQVSFAQKDMNIMTYNIRLGIASDGDNQWNNRKENLASILTYFEADICGMQEAFFTQIQDLETLLPNTPGLAKDATMAKKQVSFPVFFIGKTNIRCFKPILSG